MLPMPDFVLQFLDVPCALRSLQAAVRFMKWQPRQGEREAP